MPARRHGFRARLTETRICWRLIAWREQMRFQGSLRLDWRARRRTVGKEHAAIAWLRLEARAAATAFVKELAGIGRHGLGLGRAAMRASDDGCKYHDCKPVLDATSRRIAGQFVASWAGYPALVLAVAIASTVVAASSNTTVAVLLL